MKPEMNDDSAKRIYAFAQDLPMAEAKEAISVLFAVTEDHAWELFLRGKALAQQKGERVA